jgi:hypothetical protein
MAPGLILAAPEANRPVIAKTPSLRAARHCEERSDAATQQAKALHWIASLRSQ